MTKKEAVMGATYHYCIFVWLVGFFPFVLFIDASQIKVLNAIWCAVLPFVKEAFKNFMYFWSTLSRGLAWVLT